MSMGKDEAKEIANLIPESFYDILVYIIPGAYLIIDINIIFEIFSSTEIVSFASKDISWIILLIISLMLFGGMYYIGIILTTFSYYIIQVPCSRILEKITSQNRSRFQFDLFEEVPLKLKDKSSPVGAELIKRYARLNLNRNICLVSIISTLLLICNPDLQHLIISLSIFIISSISFIVRSKWLRGNIDSTSEIFNGL